MPESNTRIFSLPIIESSQRVRVQSVGQLQPMLGPAIRGIVAKRWKDSVCVHPLPERETNWKYCKGCEHNSTCSYGQTFEPDIPAGVHLYGGHKEAPRPLVIKPDFPLPTEARLGQTFAIKLLFVGDQTSRIDQFWSVLESALSDREVGFGHDHIKLGILPGTRTKKMNKIELHYPQEGAFLPEIEIKLTSPLIIFQKDDEDHKNLVTKPSLSQLVQSGLNLLGATFRCHATPLPDELFTTLKEMASHAKLLKSQYLIWSQPKRSNRSYQEWYMQGITGRANYGPVPIALIPWLKAMGLLHTGTHRIIGAGGWQVK